MTREEAIAYFKRHIDLYCVTGICREAEEMAIKALEQEPRKGYISVDDVMSVFDDFMCGEVDEDGTETFLEMLKDKAETPQEPRKGRWIESMPGGAEEWCYKCSECNFWKYKKTINLSKFKFCPNCGSRNEVEE